MDLRRAVRYVFLGGENSFVSKTDLGVCRGCCQTCCCRGAVAPLEDNVPVAARGGGSNGFGL